MLIVYILILVLLCANLHSFFKIIRPNNTADKNIYYLHTFIEPILRCFNVFKFKEYNEKYKINI
jgi:hypothetical protein